MNKTYLYTAMALMAGASMALTSCQSEDVLPGATKQGEKMLLTITAGRGNDATRTLLEPTEEGNLFCSWEGNEKLVAFDASNGTPIGVLDFKEYGEDNSIAVFEGEVLELTSNANDGSVVLAYMGKAYEGDLMKVENPTVVSLASQRGTMEGMTDYDVIGAETMLQKVNGHATGVVNLFRNIAHGYFSMWDGTNQIQLAAGDKITFSSENLKTKYKATFSSWGATIGNPDKNDIVITLPEDYSDANNGFYVAMVPHEVNPTVTLTKADGKQYTCVAGNHNWEKGTYVRAENGAPVKLQMSEVAEVDHSLNPLKKWAKANLVYDKATGTSYIPDNEYEGGSYYQWGRNYGWEDWQDARGSLNSSTNRYYYAVCNFTRSDGKLYTSGDGTCSLASTNPATFDAPAPAGYNNTTTVTALKDRWLMNANADQSGTGEYWVWSGGGSNWAERAQAGGYGKTTPAPAGYRMPTEADFKKIMPSTEINQASSSLHALLDKTGEIKPLNDEYEYAIKWRIVNSALQIQALVVPKGTKYSEVDWTDTNVETRVFPFGGALRSTATMFTCTDNVTTKFDLWASPVPLGDINNYGLTKRFDLSKTQYALVWCAKINILHDYSDLVGGYWVSDSKSTFYFVEREGWYSEATKDYPQSAQFRFTTQFAHNGYTIRCIEE